MAHGFRAKVSNSQERVRGKLLTHGGHKQREDCWRVRKTGQDKPFRYNLDDLLPPTGSQVLIE